MLVDVPGPVGAPIGARRPGRGASESERRIPLDEFFVGYYETTLAPGEILTAVEAGGI